MIIAIDYDNTYAADPILFNNIIKLFQDSGHTVICLTAREAGSTMAQPVLDSIGKIVGENKVVFANNQWKREAALKKGYKVDIFIDDSPEYIGPQYLVGNR